MSSHGFDSSSPLHQQTLALAGMVQAISLVHQVATIGSIRTSKASVCWQSLFETSPNHITDVYGGDACFSNLNLGLQQLEHLLKQDKVHATPELTRYLIGVIHLQGKLTKQPNILDAIGTQLERTKDQASMFGVEHANVTASLAEIYSANLSPLGYRIQVTGSPVFLQQSANIHRVRSLLLAAIRNAILWRQVGGRRWHFFSRKTAILHTLSQFNQLASPSD